MLITIKGQNWGPLQGTGLSNHLLVVLYTGGSWASDNTKAEGLL